MCKPFWAWALCAYTDHSLWGCPWLKSPCVSTSWLDLDWYKGKPDAGLSLGEKRMRQHILLSVIPPLPPPLEHLSVSFLSYWHFSFDSRIHWFEPLIHISLFKRQNVKLIFSIIVFFFLCPWPQLYLLQMPLLCKIITLQNCPYFSLTYLSFYFWCSVLIDHFWTQHFSLCGIFKLWAFTYKFPRASLSMKLS